MLNHRSFPRYNVEAYHFQLEFPELNIDEIPIIAAVDASIGGLKFESQSEVDFSNITQIKIHYKKYHFNLSVEEVWKSQKEGRFLCGFKISFKQLTDYKYWFLFIKSLHQLYLKTKA
jgi:hypothetical protein